MIFLVGGCILESIKHTWEPPLITNAILDLGEVTMFVYMVGALGHAFHWSWHQWSQGQPVFAAGGRSLLKQFLPERINIKSVLRPPRFLLRILTYIVAFLLVLAVLEMMTYVGSWINVRSGDRVEDPNNRTSVSDRVATEWHFSQMRTPSLPALILSVFNSISVWMLAGVIILAAIAIIAVAVVVIYNRRKYQH